MTDETKQQTIKKILLYPIKTTTRKIVDIKIQKIDNRKTINTGMRYIPSGSKSGSLDSDVSDLAIQFYEVIYNKTPLLTNRNPTSNDFIGDTMNTIHKDINYHCLANFWLLPSDLGRTIKNFSKAKAADRMDFFLMDLKHNYSFYRNLYPIYFDHFKNFDNFCEQHFLDEAYFDKTNKNIISTMQKDKVIDIIDQRAKTISIKKTNELFALFHDKLNII